VFELGGVGALGIAKRRVILDNSSRDKVVQLYPCQLVVPSDIDLGWAYSKQVLLLAQSVKVTSAPRQSTEVLVDHAQQVLG